MDRRSFLKALGVGTAVVVSPKIAFSGDLPKSNENKQAHSSTGYGPIREVVDYDMQRDIYIRRWDVATDQEQITTQVWIAAKSNSPIDERKMLSDQLKQRIRENGLKGTRIVQLPLPKPGQVQSAQYVGFV
jgi:hypothetical protein